MAWLLYPGTQPFDLSLAGGESPISKLTGLQLPLSAKTCPCWPEPRNTPWSGLIALTLTTFRWRQEGCFPPDQEAWLEWGQYGKQAWDLFPTHPGANKQQKFWKRISIKLEILISAYRKVIKCVLNQRPVFLCSVLCHDIEYCQVWPWCYPALGRSEPWTLPGRTDKSSGHPHIVTFRFTSKM